jgi:hypothetical protein
MRPYQPDAKSARRFSKASGNLDALVLFLHLANAAFYQCVCLTEKWRRLRKYFTLVFAFSPFFGVS